MGQQREHNRWLLDWVLGKKRQMGLCLWKSLLCLRRANMREWVIALFCCGTLGSDERRVPVVKTAKDQVFHRWREGKTSTEKWLRSPATLMLATAQEVIWFSEGQSMQQHPLGDSDIWKITFLNCWFWSLTLKLPVLQISVLLVACVVLCCAWTERQQKCREGCPASSSCSESKPWSFQWRCLLYRAQICLAEYVHFVMQHDHCLSVFGKPSGQAAAICLQRTRLSSFRRNLAEKLDPNNVLGVAVSTTDSGRANSSLCKKDTFPRQWTSFHSLMKQDMLNWQKVPDLQRVTEGQFSTFVFSYTIWKIFDKRRKKERGNFLFSLSPL